MDNTISFYKGIFCPKQMTNDNQTNIFSILGSQTRKDLENKIQLQEKLIEELRESLKKNELRYP